jgi:hypothetical protein
MEEDIRLFTSAQPAKAIIKVEERLKEAIEKAGERAAYESAHNEELLHALTVVAEFIKRKKRVCYGGTAMNAILPDSKKFYDPQFDLPDYDFYTPALDKDVEELVRDLKEAGFKDVYHRVGMHEGTKKILVNFVAVADISRIEPELFAILYKRSIQKGGMHYTDPDVLRMMMYLELSRPRGEVARWEKVFERLQLINQIFPVREKGSTTARIPVIPADIRSTLIDFCIEQQRVVCNGPVAALYKQGIRRGRVQLKEKPGGAVLFVSPDPKADAVLLKTLFKQREKGDIRMFLHKSRGEIVPERIELRLGEKPICLIVKEVACHSYNNFPLEDGRILYIGSLEFLVTLYLSLHLFTNHSTDILGTAAMAQVGEFIRLAGENYRAKRSQFPAFALSCRGHQVGYASLIRQKVQRIQREKATRRGSAKPVASKRGSTKRRGT